MRLRTCFAFVCTLAAVAVPAWAADRQVALGDSGEVYEIRSGTYGDLFPGGIDAAPENSVLALEVTSLDQPVARFLVPGTEGPEAESSPFEVYEGSSGSLFLVWQAQVGSIHTVLNLSSFKNGNWTPVIEVSGNPFAAKNSPQIAITRDLFDVKGEDGTYSTLHRTVLHLVWWEEAAHGDGNTLYAPILLLDGNYIGTNQVFSLNSYLSNLNPTGVTGAAPELFRAPRIQTGVNPRTVIAGFADPATQRLAALEISMLPAELVSLSDLLRAHIIESGARWLANGDLNGLANDVRDWILGSGARLHPGVLSYLSEKARAHIIESGVNSPSQLQHLAADARAHIIESGATMVGGRIDVVNAKAQAAFSPVIERIPTHASNGADDAPAHLFQVNLGASWPVPRTGSGVNSMYFSASGGAALVSWDTATEVRYRETTDQGWSAIKLLGLNGNLNHDQAHSVLEQRVRDR